MIFWVKYFRGLLFAPLVVVLVTAGGDAAESASRLRVRESGVPIYARQDVESEPISRLEKDDGLFPMVESVGQETWYMVRTDQGLVGWVRAVDVVAGSQVQASFKEKPSASSSWAARAEDGRTFVGTWSVEPNATARAARGFWTLKDANGSTVMSGGWSAEMHATGWNGTWSAVAEGRSSEFNGSWSAEIEPVKRASFNQMFEAAMKEAIRGLWTGPSASGSWAIRTYK